MSTLTKSNIEETIIDWFESNSFEIKAISTEDERMPDETVHLYKCVGEIYPCLFDKQEDGSIMELKFQLEVAMKDERFGGCLLVFTSDTTFKII